MTCKSLYATTIAIGAALLALSLLTIETQATDVGSRRALLSGGGAPSWVLRGNGVAATIDLNFKTGQYYQAGVSDSGILSLLNWIRASLANCNFASGIYISAPTGVPCITDQGLSIWETKTNVVLWNRDLTNAAWVKTNATVAKDQTGIDDAANVASSITATAANATVLQTTTVASSLRQQSAFVQRLVGTGEVDMTTDNGTTWTAITPCSPTAKLGTCRVIIPTQTLANPTVGFRLVVNGDKIAVDAVQNETGSTGNIVTPPIYTTSGAVVRASDVDSFIKFPTIGTGYSAFIRTNLPSGLSTTVSSFFSIDDTTNNNRAQLSIGQASGKTTYFIVLAGAGGINTSSTATINGVAGAKAALAATSGSIAGVTGTDTPSTTSSTNVPTTQLTTLRIGNGALGGNQADGFMERWAFWAGNRLPTSTLQALTGTGIADNDNQPEEPTILPRDVPRRQIWAEAR